MGPACTAYLQDTIISLDGNGHLLFTFIFILFFFLVLGIKPRASYVLGKCFTIEIIPATLKSRPGYPDLEGSCPRPQVPVCDF
jgi:hypothetical protein